MYVVAVEVIVGTEDIDGYRQAILKQANNSITKEPGCKQFEVSHDPKERTRFFLYEVYDDEAAFVVHRQTVHFAGYQQTVTPMVKDKKILLMDRITP